MQTGKQNNLTKRQKQPRRHSLWLCCSSLSLLLIADTAWAQSTTQKLLPSRTQPRSELLSAASPSSAAETEVTGAEGVPVPPADVSAARPTEDIQQLAEPAALPENNVVLPLDNEEFEARTAEDDLAPGVRIGTMVLRPTISQGISSQSERQNGTSQSRSYLTTSARGTLDSDWSRHALRVTAEGKLEHNLGNSDLDEQPSANLDAELRLDLGGDIEARIQAGYRVEQEDVNSPNAIGGVQSQGREHRVNIGAAVQREFGTLRGLAAIDLSRTSYDAAKDVSGNSISLKDRDRNEVMARTRIGYELSPALIPFLELHGGVTRYDNRYDVSGYQRSSRTVGAKLGTEFNRGEKLSGEVAVGYLTRQYDDYRLSSLGAMSFDALANWSPRRGTDVTLGLRTTLDDFAGGGESGWANYQFRSGLTHQIRSDLIGRLSAQVEYRDAQNVKEYQAGAGLTYSLNRYVDLTADATYKITPRYDSSDFIIGAGISVKR